MSENACLNFERKVSTPSVTQPLHLFFTLSVPVKLAIRFGIYIAAIAYLVVDLFYWKGPIHDTVQAQDMASQEAIAEAKAMGIAARVYYQPIYRAQVETRVSEHLWQRGRTLEHATPFERRFLREIAIEQLIDELLMKIQINVNHKETFELSEKDQTLAYEQFLKRYPTEEALAGLMKSQGWKGGDKEVKMRLNARLQRELCLQEFINEGAEVHAQDIRAFYDQHRSDFRAPERRQIQQIFLSSYTEKPAQAEAAIRAAAHRVTEEKEDFQQVADSTEGVIKPFTQEWVTEDRLPTDIALSVFSAEKNKPLVFQSKFGWHLIKVIAIEPEAEAPFEAVQNTIKNTLISDRKKAGFNYFHRLMRLRAKGKIEIFEDVLYAEELE